MTIGTMIISIGVIHTVFGLVVFRDVWKELIFAGLFNSVGMDPMRGAVAWFFLFGIPVISYGYMIRWIELTNGKTPSHVKWHLIFLFALGVILMPESGFWLLLIPIFMIFKKKGYRH